MRKECRRPVDVGERRRSLRVAAPRVARPAADPAGAATSHDPPAACSRGSRTLRTARKIHCGMLPRVDPPTQTLRHYVQSAKPFTFAHRLRSFNSHPSPDFLEHRHPCAGINAWSYAGSAVGRCLKRKPLPTLPLLFELEILRVVPTAKSLGVLPDHGRWSLGDQPGRFQVGEVCTSGALGTRIFISRVRYETCRHDRFDG